VSRRGAGTIWLLALVLLGACSSPHPRPAASPSASAARVVYVAVGASDSVGVGSADPIRGAWTQRFYRSALPISATFVNVAVSGSTTAQALQDQVPEALKLMPTLVTVWLNVNDIIHGVTPNEYRSELQSLVGQLRGGGATTVLVANTPPLDQLPAYRACLAGAGFGGVSLCPSPVPDPAALDAVVDAYNAATASVASAAGAVLVDLHAAGLAAEKDGTEASLISPDGFHPSDAGHALVAKTFADALAASGRKE